MSYGYIVTAEELKTLDQFNIDYSVFDMGCGKVEIELETKEELEKTMELLDKA